MYVYKSFLGYGIVIKRSELKLRSPYRTPYLHENFERKHNLIYMEQGYEMSDVFIGFMLDSKDDGMVNKLREAEKNFPALYEKIFSAPMNPNVIKPTLLTKGGDIWKEN